MWIFNYDFTIDIYLKQVLRNNGLSFHLVFKGSPFCVHKMAKLLIILLTVIVIAQCYTFHRYFIPGYGCGNYENEVIFMEKLPEDFEELKKLKCVSTPDYHGFQRWKMIRRSSFAKVICFT